MRLKGIYIALDTASTIAERAKEQIVSKKSSKSDDTIALKVKDPHTNEEKTLHVTFTGLRKNGFLHGHTSDGAQHIFIKLGASAERDIKHPTVVVSIKETNMSPAQRPSGPHNGISKRR
ncbi:MAG: hypothetical protein JWM07_448 [Candidatus Saccharibacteria bacterium]|nr:hypothetical protein [Candidatus Saccharibacteria bacterium]